MFNNFFYGPSFGGGSDTSTYAGCYDRKALEEGRLEEWEEKEDDDKDTDN